MILFLYEGGISMGERIKQLRKELKMTQQEFADKLKINRGTLANYEIGKNTPIDAVILSICREFNVNEDWIRTGNGEMFVKQSRDAEISNFMGSIMKGDPTFKRRLISVLARLDESQWELLEDMAMKLSDEMKKADP